MSLPNKYDPQTPQPPSTGSGRTLVILGLSAGCLTMVCCGVAGTILLYFVGMSTTTVQQVKAQIQQQVQPAPLIAPKWEQDWVVNYQLTPVFTAALDAVTANKQVQARLGDPVELAGEPEQLFRRERKGQIDLQSEETIEFDVRGSQGAAVVKAVTNFKQRPRGPYGNNFLPQKITVVLADGTEIDVPAPQPKDALPKEVPPKEEPEQP